VVIWDGLSSVVGPFDAVITYREFRRGDDDQAVRALFDAERELSQYADAALSTEGLVAWLALDVERIVGAALTRPMMDADGAARGGVDELLVAASHRGRGIGRRLMELAEAHYRAAGASGMQLTVRDGNQAAQKLYQSMGYEVVQRRLRMWKDWSKH
jgi:ribosomal protein S18 acetylase RimI-like enzyme